MTQTYELTGCGKLLEPESHGHTRVRLSEHQIEREPAVIAVVRAAVQHVRGKNHSITGLEIERRCGWTLLPAVMARILEPDIALQFAVPARMAAGHQHEMPLRSQRNPHVQIAQFDQQRPLPGFIIARILQIAMPIRPAASVERIEK